MPFYNAAETLPAALASIARQTHADWELIAVDDGSSDASAAIVAGWDDPRVVLLRRPHTGLVGALNTGLAACGGEWLARFDADDLMHRDRLAAQAGAAFDGVLGCGVEVFPREGISPGYRRYIDWLNALTAHEAIVRDLFVESPLAHPTVLLPAALLRSVGGYRDVGYPEDYDLWLRLWRAGARLAKLPRVLHYWRDHPGRLTRRHAMYRRRAFRACKLEHLLGSVLAGAGEVVIWGAGKAARQWSREVDRAGLSVACHVGDSGAPTEVRGAPVIDRAALPASSPPILVTEGLDAEREAVRAWLRASGRVEPRDFVCVA